MSKGDIFGKITVGEKNVFGLLCSVFYYYYWEEVEILRLYGRKRQINLRKRGT